MNDLQRENQRSIERVDAIERRRKAGRIASWQCCGVVQVGSRKTRPCNNRAVGFANNGMTYCAKHMPKE